MLAIAFMVASVGLIGCSDDDDDPEPEPKPEPEVPEEIKEVKFEAQSYTDWTYFSFKEGKIVEVDQEDYASDSKWDIAFLRFNIRTNGGDSGKGKGAVCEIADTKETKLDKVTEIPTKGFVTDTQISVMTSGSMPPEYHDVPGSPAFKVGENQGWATYTPPMGPWLYNNNVFVVKTADGEYAKIKMISFLNDLDKSGHITFEYVYPFK